jgi:hypothetical protein
VLDGVTSYVTTDLVLYSIEDLTALAAALQARGLDRRDGPRWMDETEWHRIAEPQWYLQFQASCEVSYNEPESEVAAILAAVEALDAPARATWDSCSQRVFDLGYDCGTKPFSVRHDFSAGTLARLAAAGATLRMTLYAFDPSAITLGGLCDAPDPSGDSASDSS